jgi:hypothetical protein
MKAPLRYSIAVLAALALSAGFARAQTIEKFEFVGGSGVGYNGVQVGPYRGMLLSEPGSPTVDIFCVDYLNEIHMNQIWTARITNLTGDLANTRLGGSWGTAGLTFFGSDDVLTRYRKAAWLTTRFAIQNTSAWGGIHSAIWLLTAPNYATNLPASLIASAQYWIGQAATNYLSIDPSHFQIVTDVTTVAGVGGAQEYIMVTPEPATVLLLGTGLAGLYAARKKRRNRLTVDT